MSNARFLRYGIKELTLDQSSDPIFRPISSYSQWVSPNPANLFELEKDAYENDPEVRFGIDFITSVSVGSGFHFTGYNSRVVDHVQQFANDSNLDEMVQIGGREALGYGNSIWQYKDVDSKNQGYDVLEQIPLTALKRIWWSGFEPNATIGYYELRGFKIEKLLPSEVIHFRWGISNASPIAIGLLAPIVTRVNYTLNQNGTDSARQRMSIMEIKRSMQDMTHKIMRRYQPRNVYNPINASPAQVSSMQSDLNVLEDEQDFVLPGEANVVELGSAARSFNTDQFTSLYSNEIIKAIGTPTSRLYEKGSLTEASAQSAKEVALMNLMGFQRMMSRMVVRQMIKPWYQANPITDVNGVVIPWDVAKIELNWGLPEKPKMAPEILVGLMTSRSTAFSDEEVRTYAADKLGVELDDNSWKLEKAEKKVEQEQMMEQKKDEFENNRK